MFDWTGTHPAAADLPIELSRDAQGNVVACAINPGHYAWTTAAGVKHSLEVAAVPAPIEVGGPWEVSFDPKNGGPDQPATFAKLEDWTKRSEEGIRNYSGVAVYRKSFELPAASPSLLLDLGDVQSIARVRVNGQEIGTLWKRRTASTSPPQSTQARTRWRLKSSTHG